MNHMTFPLRLAENLWVAGHEYFHLYVVRGRKASALIEMGISATADEVIRQLASLDVKPDFLVVTHPHGDHINGLEALSEAFPDAQVVAGKGAPEFLAHPKTINSLIEEDRFMSAFMATQGIATNRPPIAKAPSLACARIVNDGDSIDLGGLTLSFIAVKGHAPGNITVHIPEINALVGADSLGFHYTKGGFFPIFFTGYKEYMYSLEHLAALQPDILGLAHHGFMTGRDVALAFEEAQKAAVDMKDRILKDNRDPEVIARALFEEFYKDELCLYTADNIIGCCRLLIKRSRE